MTLINNHNSDPQTKRKRKRQRLDPSNSTVVVVGAGLAGLSVALSLKRAGFSNVQVYERDPSLEHQKEGYGLTLTYNPKGPLADLGVLETVANRDCPSRSHYLFRQEAGNKDNEKLAVPMGYFGNAFFEASSNIRRGYGQRGNLRVPRKVLRTILHDSLLENNDNQENGPNVHWNRTLVDFQWDESKQQYHVRFAEKIIKDGKTLEKITTVVADLLVAADGIRSGVLQQLYNQNRSEKSQCDNNESIPSIREHPEQYGLTPMSIRLVLGIADGIDHPLLQERGFYTIDTKGHRLFTMPYRSDRFDGLNDEKKEKNKQCKNRIMWQLSFSTPSNPETLDSASLGKYVADTFESWHPPVLDLVKATPPMGIWGTDLMDRNPRKVYEELIVGNANNGSIRQPRLVVCGDALHSMSPFKGQGANQALADGPLLAKWLSKSSIDAALTNWWRETLNRTVPVVEASRRAAKDWHDPNVILTTNNDVEYHGFAGVQQGALPLLVETLRARKIGPHLGGKLDSTIAKVIAEHGWFEEQINTNPLELNPSLTSKVLQLAADGNTEGLRRMSLPSSGGDGRLCAVMLTARDPNNRSCLHLAALHNHFFACKWLLAELQILRQWKRIENDDKSESNASVEKCGPKDNFGKSALDYALESGNKSLIRLFEVVLQETQSN